MRKLITKISNFFRGACHVIGTLLGIKWIGEWRAGGLLMASWIFIAGIPVGLLLIGPGTFSISAWLAAVLLVLMIVNIDDALLMMSNYLTYGVNGEIVEPYEKLRVVG